MTIAVQNYLQPDRYLVDKCVITSLNALFKLFYNIIKMIGTPNLHAEINFKIHPTSSRSHILFYIMQFNYYEQNHPLHHMMILAFIFLIYILSYHHNV